MGYELVLVEDEAVALSSAVPGLERKGHQVSLVHTPQAATWHVVHQWPDVVILNLVNGDFDAITLCQDLDATDLQIPCLILADETMALPADTDNVLKAPYTQRDFFKHLEQIATPSAKRFLRLGDIVLDTALRRVLREGQSHSLTPKEFGLLHLLASRPGEVVSRREIMKKVWETDYLGDTRTLDVHIRWLRQKIEENPSKPTHLLTMRGVGYRFVMPDSA